MDSLSPQVVFVAKLPILNPNEFDLWKMRIEQYFLMTDYSLWEVILNGDSLVPTRLVEGVAQPVAPTTVEQKLARKTELKARDTLLMALPDKNQLKFNSHKDAKLQKLVSQLEIHRVSHSQEDVNLKFLRSLPSEWKTHTLICTNDSVSAAVHVSAVGAKLSASTLLNVDSLSNAVIYSFFMAMLTMRARKFLQKTGRNLGVNGPTSMGFDMAKVECYNCHRKVILLGSVGLPSTQEGLLLLSPKEEVFLLRPQLQMHWSLSVMVPVLMIGVIKLRRNLPTLHSWLSHPFPLIHLLTVSDNDSWPPSNLYDRFVPSGGYHAVPPPMSGTFMPPKPDLVFHTPPSDKNEHLAFNSPELVKSLKHSGLISPPPMLVAPLVPLRPHSPSKGLRRTKKTCFMCKSETQLIKDCDFHARKLAQKSYASRDIHQHFAQMNHSKFPLHKVSAAASSKSQPVLTAAARTVSAVKIKFSKTRPNIASYAMSKSKSPLRRPFIRHPFSKPSISAPRVNAA
nr:hypothetical protein [Tanacetum cinerariifolium]